MIFICLGGLISGSATDEFVRPLGFVGTVRHLVIGLGLLGVVLDVVSLVAMVSGRWHCNIGIGTDIPSNQPIVNGNKIHVAKGSWKGFEWGE